MKKVISYEINVLIFRTFNSEQKTRLKTVKVRWNNRITYRHCGCYIKEQNGKIINEIIISKTLKNAPKEVIKYILFHELLHIKHLNHYKEFKSLLKCFNNFENVRNLMEVIMINQRIKSKKNKYKK